MFLFTPAGKLSEKVHPVGQSQPMAHVLWDGLWIYFNKSCFRIACKAVFQQISALYFPENNDKIDL